MQKKWLKWPNLMQLKTGIWAMFGTLKSAFFGPNLTPKKFFKPCFFLNIIKSHIVQVQGVICMTICKLFEKLSLIRLPKSQNRRSSATSRDTGEKPISLLLDRGFNKCTTLFSCQQEPRAMGKNDCLVKKRCFMGFENVPKQSVNL